MFSFIYGRSGTGKSFEIFSRASALAYGGKHVFIIVPDRDAVGAERMSASLPGAKNVDVVTFSRFANFVFRSLGGICERYITQGAKKVIMHGVIDDMRGDLSEYGGISKTDLSMTETFVSARSEMARNMISPDMMSDASAKLPGKTGGKLSDLGRIFSAFDNEVEKRWRDPDGILSRASDAIPGSGFLKGTDVFIDAFSAFTAQQYALIENISAEADSVTVSLGFEPDEDKNDPAFMSLEKTNGILRDIAKRSGKKIAEDIVLRVPKRAKNEELRLVSSSFWRSYRGSSAVYGEMTDSVRVISGANPYAEAEAVANDILRRIHNGARWRDIAVITRSVDEYDGIIDAVFRRFGIPYFISKRVDINELAPIKLIMCALSMRERGFLRQELVPYMKTGLCGVSYDDICEFENYIIKWNINGKKFSDEFYENPRGMSAPFGESEAEALSRINETRKAVISPLERFFGVMKNADTVRENATALYDFLSMLRLPEQLFELANAAHDSGDIMQENMMARVWRVLCDALDCLVTSVGDRKCDAARFKMYLRAVLSETDIGQIPTSVDEVLIADAVLTSVQNARTVYVIGCYDGGFPKRVGEDGIFTEREKDELARVGIGISSRLWKKLSDEMYYFYTAVTSPSDDLVITYPRFSSDGKKLDISLGAKRVFAMFPMVKEQKYEDLPRYELVWEKKSSFEHSMGRDSVSRALREYYENDTLYAERLKSARIPLSADGCAIDVGVAKDLFGNKINTSSSRLEKYIKCRFAYFCEYELKLEDNEAQKFGAVDIGSFMHKLMELAVKFVVTHADADDEETERAIKSAADGYLSTLFRGIVPKKMERVSRYLCKSARAFIEKMKPMLTCGGFRPMSFELGIGSDGVDPMVISSDDGSCTVRIRGKIDRVDGWEDDGGNLRLIVSDYKTGAKKFDIDNVHIGLDMQMLLYLFSLCQNGSDYYGKNVTPAGIVYVGIRPPTLDLKLEEEADVGITQSGLFLSDMETLCKMEPGLDGRFFPIKESDIKKYAETGKIKNLISYEAFDELKKEISETVLRYANELICGKAYSVPLQKGEDSPCRYCKYHAVCRHTE